MPEARLARLVVVGVGVAGVLAAGLAAQANPVEDYYKGKSIEVIIGYSSGGGYDTYARTVTRHMTDHMPGRPNFVRRVCNHPAPALLSSAVWVGRGSDRLSGGVVLMIDGISQVDDG